MIKLQIGENTVCLTKEEQDFLFQLLDEKYDMVENIPTFNAIRNWMYAEGCRPSVVKVEDPWDKTVVEDPWNDEQLQKRLSQISRDALNKRFETQRSTVNDVSECFEDKQPQDEVRYKNLRDILIKLLSNNENGYYIAC